VVQVVYKQLRQTGIKVVIVHLIITPQLAVDTEWAIVVVLLQLAVLAGPVVVDLVMVRKLRQFGLVVQVPVAKVAQEVADIIILV
jgi:hypothetical protein